MFEGHSTFGAVKNVSRKVLKVGQWKPGAVNILACFVVDMEKVIGAWPTFNIDIFAQLNISVGAKDRKATVTQFGRASGVYQSMRA